MRSLLIDSTAYSNAKFNVGCLIIPLLHYEFGLPDHLGQATSAAHWVQAAQQKAGIRRCWLVFSSRPERRRRLAEPAGRHRPPWKGRPGHNYELTNSTTTILLSRHGREDR
jgi:hypothetical protein